jgi:hypothetical protein
MTAHSLKVVAIVGLLQLPAGTFAQDLAERIDSKKLEVVLRDFENIRVGMTRAEVLARFQIDGGIHSASEMRFVHPLCSYCKVTVKFDFIRDSQDQNRAIMAETDRVVAVSRPYLERPFAD